MPSIIRILLCLVCIAPVFADKPLLAVLPVKVEGAEAKNLFSKEDVGYMSDAIRAEASRRLGSQVQILSQLQIDKLVTANIQECSGVGCFAGFLKTISADYGLQPTVRFAAGKLRLTLEMASNEATLGMREYAQANTQAGKNDLIEKSTSLSVELFSQLVGEIGGGLSDGAGKSTAAQTPVEAEEVGTNVTIELTDGSGVVLVDNRVACSSKDRCTKELSNGSHAITATRDGYRDSTFTISVPKGSNRYALALVSKAGILTIRAQNGDGEAVTASVVVDGRVVGQTPWSGPVAVAARSVTVRVDGFSDADVSERPGEGKKKSVTVTLESNKPKVTQGMVQIPAGCFQMGSNDGGDDEKPVHQVCLSAFQMDKYEVTQGQYRSAMGASGHTNDGTCWAYNLTSNNFEQGATVTTGFLGDNKPVLCVDWTEAKRYCEKQSKRLPTEAEFEYATRAGTSTTYFWGNDTNQGCRYANGTDLTPMSNGSSWNSKMECKDGYGDAVAPVGNYQSNPWGLYDMTGNVLEWTSDWYGDRYYGQSTSQDPRGSASGSYRVFRGGGWYGTPAILSSTFRDRNVPSYRGTLLGFRCAL